MWDAAAIDASSDDAAVAIDASRDAASAEDAGPSTGCIDRKAGGYNQNDGGSEDDYAQVTFFELSNTHR